MGILGSRSAFRHVHGLAVVMFAAVLFSPAVFAQTGPEEEYVDLLGVADIVNLLRTVVDPSSSPVLSTPVERAVSAQAVPPAADSAGPRVVMVRPTVILPDIDIPDEDSDAPESVAAETKREEPEPAASKTLPRARATDDDDGPDIYPTFQYVFFFGDYVPYFDGWYYYSDTWYWGRRGPHPPEPPGWIPPPPPPDLPFRLLLPGVRLGNGHVTRGGTRTAVSGAGTRTIIGPQAPGSSSLPGAVRIPRKNDR